MKVLFVAPRFGPEILGGSEKLAWELGNRLNDEIHLEVATSCAKDYRSWSNFFPAGKTWTDKIQVHRFPVARERNWQRFGKFSSLLFRWNQYMKIPRFIEEYWLKAQGPYCPDLIRFLLAQYQSYDRFLFFTYLYYPTAQGLPAVRDKSVLISTAHDEPALRFSIYETLFELCRSIIFLSSEERELVHRRFQNQNIPNLIAGYGVELQPVETNTEDFFLYAGRIEKGKNCPELFRFCKDSGIRLKAIGSSQIEIPPHVDFLGFVDESEKRHLLSKCKAVIVPSKNESLSIIALEAWSYGKPVVVHAESPVLVGHVERSGGGYVYRDGREFFEVTKNIDAGRGLKGREYVKKKYSWEELIPKFHEALRW